MQHRVLEKGSLLDWRGTLLEEGFSVGEIRQLDSKKITDKPRFIKNYDSYSVLSDYFQIHLSVIESAGNVISAIKLYEETESKCFFCRRIEKNASAILSDSPGSTVVHTVGEKYEITFRRKTNEIHLYGHIYDFMPNTPLLFDFVLKMPYDESFAFYNGFPHADNKFCYITKKTSMPADGKIIFGEKEILFGRGASFANSEFMRASLPKKHERNSIYLCGISHGRRIGVALGSETTMQGDTSENVFFVDGKLNKLAAINIQIATVNGEKGVEQPWTIMDTEGRIKLLFKPKHVQNEKAGNWLKPCHIKYLFGNFSGQLVNDAGERFEIINLPGFIRKCSVKI